MSEWFTNARSRSGKGLLMKQVLRHIFARKRVYDRLPLFEWMRDESLSARERLAFYPCMAPFILSFGDLNKFVLRDSRVESVLVPIAVWLTLSRMK